MRKWAAILAIAGGGWMILVIHSGSLLLATISNYPGLFASRWFQYRGIAPSPEFVWGFNIWLVVSSAVEWVVVGLALRAVLRPFLT